MKTVCHALPDSYPMDCRYILNFTENLSFPHSNTRWGDPGGQKYVSLIACLMTQQVDNFGSYLWLGETVKVLGELLGFCVPLSHTCGLSLFLLQSSGVRWAVGGGVWMLG